MGAGEKGKEMGEKGTEKLPGMDKDKPQGDGPQGDKPQDDDEDEEKKGPMDKKGKKKGPKGKGKPDGEQEEPEDGSELEPVDEQGVLMRLENGIASLFRGAENYLGYSFLQMKTRE